MWTIVIGEDVPSSFYNLKKISTSDPLVKPVKFLLHTLFPVGLNTQVSTINTKL